MAKRAIGSHLLELAHLIRTSEPSLEPKNWLWRPGGLLAVSELEEPDEEPDEEPGKEAAIPDSIREHKGYVWLHMQPPFEEAKHLYESYGGEGLDFVELVALFLGTHIYNPKWQPKMIDAATKTKVVAASGHLSEFLSEYGLQTIGYHESGSLQISLTGLITQLETSARPYRGKNAAQRTIVKELARALKRRRVPKRKASGIIKAIAPLFEFSLSDRTRQNLVRAAWRGQ